MSQIGRLGSIVHGRDRAQTQMGYGLPGFPEVCSDPIFNLGAPARRQPSVFKCLTRRSRRPGCCVRGALVRRLDRGPAPVRHHACSGGMGGRASSTGWRGGVAVGLPNLPALTGEGYSITALATAPHDSVWARFRVCRK